MKHIKNAFVVLIGSFLFLLALIATIIQVPILYVDNLFKNIEKPEDDV